MKKIEYRVVCLWARDQDQDQVVYRIRIWIRFTQKERILNRNIALIRIYVDTFIRRECNECNACNACGVQICAHFVIEQHRQQ